MKTSGANKVIIKVASQEHQVNARNSRRTLKSLQEAAGDKENLAGRIRVGKNTKLAGDDNNEIKKRKKLVHKSVQTSESVVTAEDLTSTEEPSADYWRLLAEKRGEALEQLNQQIEALEEENRVCKEMLEESKHLVEVLQEMVGEADTSTEVAEEATEST